MCKDAAEARWHLNTLNSLNDYFRTTTIHSLGIFFLGKYIRYLFFSLFEHLYFQLFIIITSISTLFQNLNLDYNILSTHTCDIGLDMRHIYQERHIDRPRSESIYKPVVYLQHGNWTIDNTLGFYWALSKYTQFKDAKLITDCQYFGKIDIEHVEEIESIMNPIGSGRPYDSIIATVKFARTHRQKTSLSEAIATRLSQIHNIYVEAGRKHTMNQINDRLFITNSMYSVQLGSLSKTGRLFEYSHLDEFGKEMCRVRKLNTPDEFKDFVLQESALLVKALVRYILLPNLFYSVDSAGRYVKPIHSGRPLAVTLELSDAEQYIWALLGRHGISMVDYLDNCISNATNAFVEDSPAPITQYGTLFNVTKSTPDWVRAGLLGDMLRVYLGVDGFMSEEIRESRLRYENSGYIANPVPTTSLLAHQSVVSHGGNPAQQPEHDIATSYPPALMSTQMLPPIAKNPTPVASSLVLNPTPAIPWSQSKSLPGISVLDPASSPPLSTLASTAAPISEEATLANIVSSLPTVLSPVLSLAPLANANDTLAPVILPGLMPQQTILPTPILAPTIRSNMAASNMVPMYDDLVKLLVNIPVTNEANAMAADLLSSLGF